MQQQQQQERAEKWFFVWGWQAAREVQAAAVFYKPYGQQANPTPESAGEMSGYT